MIAMRSTRMLILAQSSFDFIDEGETGGKIIRRGRLKPGVISKLRCPFCGGKLTIHEYHRRHFHDLEHDEDVIYKLPRLICNSKQCPHCDNVVRKERRRGKRKIPSGATHLVFPSFMCPYVRINSKYMTLLAKAQMELDAENCHVHPNSGEFKEVVEHNVRLSNLKRQCGDLWDYLKLELNSRAGHFYCSYFKTLCDMAGMYFRNYVLNHFYSKHSGIINGFIRTVSCNLTPHLHRACSLLRVLLSEFVHHRPTYSFWPPPVFLRKIRSVN